MPSRSFRSRKISLSQTPTSSQTTPTTQFTNPKSKPKYSTTPNTLIQQPSSPQPTTPPQNWPQSLLYLTNPIHSPYLPQTHLKWLHHRPADLDLPTITFPLSQHDIPSRVEIRLINDPGHPACGQRGLFAARDLSPGELVVVYLGYVHGGTEGERREYERRRRSQAELRVNEGGEIARSSDVVASRPVEGELLSSPPSQSQAQPGSLPYDTHGTADGVDVYVDTVSTEHPTIGSWDTSSYDLNMYRDDTIELAVDAANIGNEARFVNDYRGVPVPSASSTSVSTHANDINNERWEKRKVKVKVKGENTTSAAAETVVGGGGGEWQSSWHDKNSGSIAMPNAEFRDVWFDIPEDVDLIVKSLKLSTSKSAAAEEQQGRTDLCHEEILTRPAEDSLIPTLDNLQLDKPPPAHMPTESSNNVHPPRRKRKPGIRGVAIFVMPAGKSGKRKHGIKKGQEILVSYGKGFWAHHASGS